MLAPEGFGRSLVPLAGVTAVFLLLALPRLLLRRAQDRLARRLLAENVQKYKLLTRAELVVGEHRRLPGVLGLTEAAVEFHGLFGESAAIPTAGIRKIITGQRLATGRRLMRLEVLRLSPSGGGDLELVLTRASASAWRSHLGLWAVQERKAAMDVVAPGRK